MEIEFQKLKDKLNNMIDEMEWEKNHQEYAYINEDFYKQLLECVNIAEQVNRK
jgi:hypothetical protein